MSCMTCVNREQVQTSKSEFEVLKDELAKLTSLTDKRKQVVLDAFWNLGDVKTELLKAQNFNKLRKVDTKCRVVSALEDGCEK